MPAAGVVDAAAGRRVAVASWFGNGRSGDVMVDGGGGQRWSVVVALSVTGRGAAWGGVCRVVVGVVGVAGCGWGSWVVRTSALVVGTSGKPRVDGGRRRWSDGVVVLLGTGRGGAWWGVAVVVGWSESDGGGWWFPASLLWEPGWSGSCFAAWSGAPWDEWWLCPAGSLRGCLAGRSATGVGTVAVVQLVAGVSLRRWPPWWCIPPKCGRDAAGPHC